MAELNTPKLYNYNNEQYSYDDLSKYLDAGFADYISTLSRGDKDSDEFWNAYTNLMSGIADGTIYFLNGRFHDTLGRYSNGTWYDSEGKKLTSNKKSKDYYGLVANYIARGLSRLKKYVAPEPEADPSKIKWGNTAGTEALGRLYFNSSTPNITYFLDLDPVVDGQRGVTNRVTAIRDFIKNNFLGDAYNNTFSGYTDSDKVQFTKYAQEAYDALADNTIDAGDKLILSRIFPNVDLDLMFYTGEGLGQPQLESELLKPELSPLGFLSYLDTNWARKPNDSGYIQISNSGVNYGDWTANKIILAILSADEDTLFSYLGTAINELDREFGRDDLFKGALGNEIPHIPSQMVALLIIGLLNRLGKLILDKDNPDIYYIPGMLDMNTNSGYYYDKSTKTVYKKSVRDIPYWQNLLWAWYSGNTLEPLFNRFFNNTQSKKNGGILKAYTGSQLWSSGLIDFDPNKYTYSYDTTRLVNADMSDEDYNPWISNKPGLGTGRYLPTLGNSREHTQNIENTKYYKKFGEDLLNLDGTFTDTGLTWAKAVDEHLPEGSLASFFDKDGKIRTSWTVTNPDVYGRDPHTFTKLADYVNYVRNDQILGTRHNVFLNRGKRYFYIDLDGKEHWVDPAVISKYIVSSNPVRSGWNNDETVYWDDYILTGLVNDKLDKSHVNPEIEDKENEYDKNKLLRFALKVTPDILEAGRLLASLRANNKIAKILDRSISPVLRDTYERYSPITGAFSEMLARNRLAADLRRLAARPFTSDASLQLAGQLDADRLARDLEYQGFLADDKEIKRTLEAALARQEDNMARRSEVANFNRASINKANREKAEIEASRIRKNWEGIDNSAKGYILRLRANIALKEALMRDISSRSALSEYQNYVRIINDNYLRDNPSATSESMLRDPAHVDRLRRLRDRYNYEMNQIGLGKYLTNPYKGRIPETYEQIVYSKKGGSLKPSIMYLINKTIRNEGNS